MFKIILKYMCLELEKIDAKSFQFFPLRTDIVPKYIPIDMYSLSFALVKWFQAPPPSKGSAIIYNLILNLAIIPYNNVWYNKVQDWVRYNSNTLKKR